MSEAPIVALALGGGAARGLAHIGVLEVFDEHRIPVDLIVGCSMGSVVGAMYACGTPAKMIHGIAGQLFAADYRKIFDITLPRLGLVRGQRIDTIIRTVLGDREFQQLKIPFAAVAACLEDNVLKVFNEGKVANAVRASISIPGIFEPVTIEGKTYVDGGVLDRVPAGVCRSMQPDLVIAVDVSYHGEPRPAPRNIIDVLMSSYELLEWEATRNRLLDADIAITPDTRTINPANFNTVEECVAIGRDATLQVLEGLKERLRGIGVDV